MRQKSQQMRRVGTSNLNLIKAELLMMPSERGPKRKGKLRPALAFRLLFITADKFLSRASSSAHMMSLMTYTHITLLEKKWCHPSWDILSTFIISVSNWNIACLHSFWSKLDTIHIRNYWRASCIAQYPDESVTKGLFPLLHVSSSLIRPFRSHLDIGTVMCT